MKKRPPVRTWIEINKAALYANLKFFERRAGDARMMAVIKSNAYGHGLVTIAKLLAARSKKLWFGVDSMTEALRLRREKLANQTLVLGYTLPELLKQAQAQNISITISNLESLKQLANLKIPPCFHLKIETGLNRLGFSANDLPRVIALLQKSNLTPEGIYSHLAEPPNRAYTKIQIKRFTETLERFQAAGIKPKFRHLAKTEGIAVYPEIAFDMARLGIGLYGYYPSRFRGLRPVMAWKTIIAEIKTVKKGAYIGYGLTERLTRDSRLAVLPIGYWHGYDRKLSSIGETLVCGKRAKVMGRVCMDMTVIDVTDAPNVKAGNEVVLIGAQGKDFISADELAQKVGTTSYEILTRVNPLIYKIAV